MDKGGYAVPGKSRKEIEMLAEAVRSELNLGNENPDMIRLLEAGDNLGFVLNVIPDEECLKTGSEAFYNPTDATLNIPDSIYMACNDPCRAKFTVAHELGHHVLKHNAVFARASPAPHRTCEDSEWQANTFASFFLMPTCVIESESLFTASQIADRFQVSYGAANVRLDKYIKTNPSKAATLLGF